MQMGDHLGWAGLILGLVSLALTYLLPNKKWIGYIGLLFAAITLGMWCFFAHKAAGSPRPPAQSVAAPSLPTIVIQDSQDSDCTNIAAGRDADVNGTSKDKNDPHNSGNHN
jgi:cadmium resistance protein CadD (predicted permease)